MAPAGTDTSARIVVADDDPASLEGLRALLAAWGYEVETAPDGRAALEKVSEVHPSAVITDLVMPTMNGLELLPVILLTAHGNLNHLRDAAQQGAFAYLRKPVDVLKLKTVLASALAA